MQVLSPHPQRAPGFRHSSEAQASRVGIQRRHRVFSCESAPLLPRRSKGGVVRCSPRLRRCSNATRSVQRRLWPGVQSVGVGHSEPPVKGSRLRSLEPLCLRRMQAPTQKQEAPTSTSEGRVGPSAVGRGSSQRALTGRMCVVALRIGIRFGNGDADRSELHFPLVGGSGDHGGSQTSSTLASSTPSSAAMAFSACVTIWPAIGQVGLVGVISASLTSDKISRLEDVPRPHPGHDSTHPGNPEATPGRL